ncbi:MAG: methylmalonyl-CoA mutase family protein [Candidatus Eisenbacteria bacterium]|nr:methylmalonyl-CoA mutase family protein [Candidatus Eisenbacteria bacterium]
MNDEISTRKKDWQRKPGLSEQGPRLTSSGIPVEPLYCPRDDETSYYAAKLGLPGTPPYTRGIHPTMYRGKLWTMRQYAGFGDALETNKRLKLLLEHGQTGLSIAFDLPTQMGYDSDNPIAAGEVGRVGVAIDSLEDMQILFDGIPLDKVSTSMTINATAPMILAMYVACAEKQGVPAKKLAGTVQNDILKEYVARGTYIFPPEESLRLTIDLFSFCQKEMPLWNMISVSGYHIREAGATAVQELAFTFGDAIAYLEAARRAGLDIDRISQRISFFFACHNDFFEEISKFRAARRIWFTIMKKRFGAQDESSKLRFHTQTGGSTLTRQQAEINIVRVALQALAAVLGGTQSLHTNSFDEAISLPSELAVRVALRTQQILAEETGIASVVDPAGGSYYVEALTDEIEKQVMEYLEKIDAIGGMLRAIETGFVQREIHKSAYAAQKAIETGEKTIVGVNKFKMEEEEKVRFKPPEASEKSQIERLNAFKKSRNEASAKESLAELKKAIGKKQNPIPQMVSAVKAGVTLGEMRDVLSSAFGEYKGQAFL